jgi:hypothetical protein
MARWNCAARTEEACGDGSTGRAAGGLLRTLFCLALSIAALPSAAAAEQAGTLEVDVGSARWPGIAAMGAAERHRPAVRCA